MPTRTRPAGIRPLRFTRKTYHRFARKHVLRPDHRIELLDGIIYEPLTMSDAHWCILTHIRTLLVKLSDKNWFVTSRCPVVLSDYSEPDPDIAVIRGEILDYREGVPKVADVPVVIEVSDETLQFDRGRRLHVYAEAGLPEYWIVNLPERVIEVRTEPRPRDGNTHGTYAALHEYRGDEQVPLRLGGQTLTELPVAELIPL